MVDFEPTLGSEAARARPAVVVSNDGANIAAVRSGRGVITVVPLTTNTERVFSFQALIPPGQSGLEHDGKAMAEQVRAVSVARMGRVIATLPEPLMERADSPLCSGAPGRVP